MVVPEPDVQQLPSLPQGSPVSLVPASVKFLKHIPKASRDLACLKLTAILESVVARNDTSSWRRLLFFGPRCLRVPQTKSGRRQTSLATLVNNQLRLEEDASLLPPRSTRARKPRKARDTAAYLARQVSLKLEEGEGDFKGAVQLACSEDTIADRSDSILEALRSKHPPPHPDISFPHQLEEFSDIEVSTEEVIFAIKSFPAGSAGAPDGLRPQHLKDMIHPATANGSTLVSNLSRFTSLVLQGRVLSLFRPFFFGAWLTALTKKEGGVKPIAVGCTLRHLIAKVVGQKVREKTWQMCWLHISLVCEQRCRSSSACC